MKKKSPKLSKIKKEIQVFLSSEEGKINKKDVAKLGKYVLALGIGLEASGFIRPDAASAQCWVPPGGTTASY